MRTESKCPMGCECLTVQNGVQTRCEWYVHMQGENPLTGEIMDEDRCALAWMPILLAEVARSSRGTSAAVESFRNETTMATNNCVSAIVDIAQHRLKIGR